MILPAHDLQETGCPWVLRAGFESTGSPRWIMETIRRRGLDERYGFRLHVDYRDDRVQGRYQSTEAALAEGVVDFIDTDWISIARARKDGLAIRAVHPYGRIMGGLVASRNTAVNSLEDLRSCRIGVVRLLDKNWAVVRAVTVKRHGFDPQETATVLEVGSKTVLMEKLNRADVDAGLLYWHLVPRVTVGGGCRVVADVLDLLPELGISEPPTTFFTFSEAFISQYPKRVRGFVSAYRDAVRLLRENEAFWTEVVAEAAGVGDHDLLAALRTAWLRRIVPEAEGGTVADLRRLLDTISQYCGDLDVGVEAVSEQMFWIAGVSAGEGE